MKKTKQKKARSVSRKSRDKMYPPYLLGLILVAVLLLEAALIMTATSDDWKAGLTVLDISNDVYATASSLESVMEPVVFTVETINEFYNQASIAAAEVLDLSGNSNAMAVIEGGNEVYQVAKAEMASVLDLSHYASFNQPQVAGAEIFR